MGLVLFFVFQELQIFSDFISPDSEYLFQSPCLKIDVDIFKPIAGKQSKHLFSNFCIFLFCRLAATPKCHYCKNNLFIFAHHRTL